MTLRRPEDCRYRNPGARHPGAAAACGLLASLTGLPEGELLRADRHTCSACCRHAEPTAESLTPVVASLLYRAASGILRAGGAATSSAAKAESLRARAVEALERVVPALLYDHEEMIDHSVTAAVLADLLQSRRPFTYLRYGDSEWLSLLGFTGVNGNGHNFFPETLGRELRRILEEIAGLRDRASPLFVGTTHLLQQYVQPFIVANGLKDRVPWVSASIFPLGLADLSTRRFVEAAAAYKGPKYLVANRSLRPVARALGCWHIVIPFRDCSLHLDWVEAALRFRGPGLVLSCASMMSECLLWSLLRANPEGTYVDCGSVFDWMLGLSKRRAAIHFREILEQQYFPIFREYQSTWGLR